MIGEAPEDVRVIFLDSVSIPHYREREYRKVGNAALKSNGIVCLLSSPRNQLHDKGHLLLLMTPHST